MLIGLLIFSLLFGALALSHLDWAILLLIFSLPSYLIRFNIFGLPTTLLEVMILITFFIWFIKFLWPNFKNFLKNRKKNLPYPFSWEIILI